MGFKLDDKVTWIELAPSVQDDFRNQNKNIINERAARIAADKIIKGKIDKERIDMEKHAQDIMNYLLSLQGSGDYDPKLTKFINDNLVSDEPNKDKFVKVDKNNNTLFVDDNFRSINVVVNDAELNQMKNSSGSIIDLADVFNNWYRFAHYSRSSRIIVNAYWPEINGFMDAGDEWQNSGYNYKYTKYWQFDRATQSLVNPIDYSPYMGFISPKNFYTNYFVRLRFTSSDNDFVSLIAGYMVDSKGKEHTLSFVRSTGEDDINITWALIYDLDCNTQFIINDKSSIVPKTFGGTVYFSLKRKNQFIEGRTGNPNSDVDDPNFTITLDFPSFKPTSWPQEMYDNIKVMLTETNRVGVGAANMPVSFKIVEQYELFETGYIYALHTDQVWDYDFSTSQWKVIGTCSDMLPNRIFLYNSKLWNFYFYYYPGKWQKISGHKA